MAAEAHPSVAQEAGQTLARVERQLSAAATGPFAGRLGSAA